MPECQHQHTLESEEYEVVGLDEGSPDGFLYDRIDDSTTVVCLDCGQTLAGSIKAPIEPYRHDLADFREVGASGVPDDFEPL